MAMSAATMRIGTMIQGPMLKCFELVAVVDNRLAAKSIDGCISESPFSFDADGTQCPEAVHDGRDARCVGCEPVRSRPGARWCERRSPRAARRLRSGGPRLQRKAVARRLQRRGPDRMRPPSLMPANVVAAV